MNEAINYLNTELGIDTSNVVRAVQDAGELEFDADTYRRIIGEVCGTNDVNVGDDEAKLCLMYIVQDVARKLPADLQTAEEKAIEYVSKHPWVLAKPDYEDTYVPKSTVDALGNPKQKKGAKKAAAIKFYNAHKDDYTTRKEWIAALMENVGLTSGAASTYHHNLKKGLWS